MMSKRQRMFKLGMLLIKQNSNNKIIPILDKKSIILYKNPKRGIILYKSQNKYN